MNLDAAVQVYQALMLAGAMLTVGGAAVDTAEDGARELVLDPAVSQVLDGQVDDSAYDTMAWCVRQIGRQVTPLILASHLHLEKHRDTPEPSRAEMIAYQGFISTLLDLDDLKMTIAAEQARKEHASATVAPTPIEDTIMEPVEDFFAPTW